MNTPTFNKLRAAILFIGSVFALSANAMLVPVTSISGHTPFECSLTATQVNVTISNNATVQAMIYQDTGPGAATLVTTNGIPIPVMTLNVGDIVICHFKNNLPAGNFASIHWHGIELDNDSDGTGVTQSAVRPGESYDYKFQISRPGVFWFHNHELPGQTTFAGMYGVIIVPNPNEQTLVSNGTLPSPTNTFTLAMSDIDYNPANGFIGKFYNGTNVLGTNVWLDINSLVEMCHLARIGDPHGDVVGCTLAGSPGSNVLVNGYCPTPGGNNSSFTVHSGQRIRLRLLNEALSRDFRVSLLYPNTNRIGDTKLYRIGGQGGLLDAMRLEGGTNNGGQFNTNGVWETLYNQGEIVIGSGERSDVIIYPTGTNGDVIQLVGNPLPGPFNLSGTAQNNVTPIPTNYPIASFTIMGANDNNTNTPPANGAQILPAGQTNASLAGLPTNPLTTPPAPYAGTINPVITLGTGKPINTATTNTPQNNPVVFTKGNPNVDGYAASLDSNIGGGSWTNIVRAPSTLYARVGDLLELSVDNPAGGPIHPYHLHGFSLQPLRLVDDATKNVYNYPYREFVDTIEVYPGETLVFRVRLDDRPKFCDSGTGGPVLLPCTGTTNGGAIGRWLFHCHIFLHAGVGMMGELDVLSQQMTNYVQAPDLTTNGVDVLATTNTGSQTVADDFVCLTNGPITGVSIWGSWLNDLVDTNSAFDLKFWIDVPAFTGSPNRPSRPGWQLWEQMFPPGSYAASLASSNTVEVFYDPSTGQRGVNTNVYRYDFVVPPELAFYEQSNKVYWLSVSAYTTNKFGWHSSLISANFRDAATWSQTLFGPNWGVLQTNNLNQGQPMNESFQLTSPATFPTITTPIPGAIYVLPPVLSTTLSDGNIGISWSGGGILQSADELTGPWSDIDGAKSPYVVPMDASQRFYRVRMP